MFGGNEKYAKCLLKFAKNVEDERYEMTLRTSIVYMSAWNYLFVSGDRVKWLGGGFQDQIWLRHFCRFIGRI